MKHTNFHEQIEAIKAQERKEFREALMQQPGMEFDFSDKDEEIPVVGFIGFDHPRDIEIRKAYFDNDGRVVLLSADVEDPWDEIEVSLDEIEVGHLSYVTELLPEPNKETEE